MRDKLTDTAIRNAKPRGKPYKLSDGAGLHLLISPNGSKLWRLRYRYDGAENMLSLGPYDISGPSHVSLSRAREKRDEARKALQSGKNPSAERKAAKQPTNGASTTFENVARRWIAMHRKTLDDKYGAVIERRLERHFYPKIGSKDVATISGPVLLKVIKEIEESGSIDLSRRMKIIAGQIFRYAVAHGWAERDSSNDIRDGLTKRPRVRHRASLKPSDLPEFFARLERYNGYRITKLALQFTLLTAARTDEVRFAPWSEIEDLDVSAPLWRIPPERMKMERPHLVPLAPQGVGILREARRLYPKSNMIFPSEESRSGVMSENAMLYALYYLGFKGKATVHGFRGTFSTILNENGFNRDWIEIQLAHAEDDEIRAAYNAAQWLPQRREMMCWWANYLDERRRDCFRKLHTFENPEGAAA